MRKFDTKVQHLKYKVLREVAKQAWADTLQDNLLDIPKIIVPGKIPTMRCCVYKERAILAERVKLAMGGNKQNPNVIEVLDIACDECPMGGYEVTNACRGCLAHRSSGLGQPGALMMATGRPLLWRTRTLQSMGPGLRWRCQFPLRATYPSKTRCPRGGWVVLRNGLSGGWFENRGGSFLHIHLLCLGDSGLFPTNYGDCPLRRGRWRWFSQPGGCRLSCPKPICLGRGVLAMKTWISLFGQNHELNFVD